MSNVLRRSTGEPHPGLDSGYEDGSDEVPAIVGVIAVAALLTVLFLAICFRDGLPRPMQPAANETAKTTHASNPPAGAIHAAAPIQNVKAAAQH